MVEATDGSTGTFCDHTTLAFAFACSIDQFDRPVIGAINFCLENIMTRIGNVSTGRLGEEEQKLSVEKVLSTAKIVGQNDPIADVTYVAIHEVAHALGFSFDLFKYFRNPETGEPLTPRPFVPTNVTCVDGTTQTMVWPAANTIQTRLNWDGRIYHEVVTPRVTQVARNQFNCQNLTGARLGTQSTSLSFSCTDSHWDERLFLSELMGPIFSGYTDALSPLTLALFEDSGWYKVSYETAELSPFGKGRGCDFVNDPCINNDGIPVFGKDIFCNSPSSFETDGVTVNNAEVVCEPTHKSFAVCDLFDINALPTDIAQFVPRNGVRYFSNTDLSSVLFPTADYCPLPLVPANLDCTNTLNSTNLQIYQGESRGISSRCVNGEFDGIVFPGCFEIECDATQHKVIIAGMTCEYDGQLLSIPTVNFGEGTLECPYLATICPELFCPGECSGRGVCDYGSVPPRCNCFDTTDATVACSKDTPLPPATQSTQSPTPPLLTQSTQSPKPPLPTQSTQLPTPPLPTQSMQLPTPSLPTQSTQSPTPPLLTLSAQSPTPPLPTQSTQSSTAPLPTQSTQSRTSPLPTQSTQLPTPPVPTQSIQLPTPPVPTQSTLSPTSPGTAPPTTILRATLPPFSSITSDSSTIKAVAVLHCALIAAFLFI